MIQVDNQYNSEGILFKRTIEKDDEFYSLLELNYENNKLISKYHIIKLSNDNQLTTHHWGFNYDENQKLISNYKTMFLGDKYDHNTTCNKITYDYNSGVITEIKDFELGFGGIYKNQKWSTHLEYNNDRLVMLQKNVFEIDIDNYNENLPFKEIPFEENELIYNGSIVIGKSYNSLHEDLYGAPISYNGFRYDNNGVFFWDYSWHKMFDSMDEYEEYEFDCNYRIVNDKIGERLSKSNISHRGATIGCVSNSYSKR